MVKRRSHTKGHLKRHFLCFFSCWNFKNHINAEIENTDLICIHGCIWWQNCIFNRNQILNKRWQRTRLKGPGRSSCMHIQYLFWKEKQIKNYKSGLHLFCSVDTKSWFFHLSQGSITILFLWGVGNKKLVTIVGISKRGSTTAGGEKWKKKYVQLCQMNCWVMVSELRRWKLLERKDTKWKWQKQFDEVVRTS